MRLFNQSVSIPKRHHVLPEFYLNGFARGGYLVVFDRERKSFRRQKPRNTAVIRHFYTFTNKAGAADTSLETMLSQFEGWASSAFVKLEKRLPLTSEERSHVAYFIALLHTRTPRFEREVLSLTDAAAKLRLRSHFPTVDSVASHFKESMREPPDSAEEFFKFIHCDEYEIAPDRDNAIHAMLDLAPGIGDKIAAMNWIVVHASGSDSFITTDSPVGFIALPGEELVRGIGSPGVLKVVPLSAGMMLLIGTRGAELTHQAATAATMEELNTAVAAECEGYLIGRDEHVVRSVVQASGLDVALPGPTLTVDSVEDPTDAQSLVTVLRRISPNRR